MKVENRSLFRPVRWLYLYFFVRSVSAAVTDPRCSCRDYGSCLFNVTYGKQNMAIGKTTKISSVFSSLRDNEISGPACLAVNGKITKTFRPINQFPDSPNCIHTGVDDREPYWEVDLGQRYNINSIRIFWRDTRLLERSDGVKITVDGQLCHTFKRPVSNPSDITCSTHLAGQTVRLSKNDHTTHNEYYITVCEVEVWVCRPGYFGSQCQHVCPAPVCQNNQICSPVDGTCPKGDLMSSTMLEESESASRTVDNGGALIEGMKIALRDPEVIKALSSAAMSQLQTEVAAFRAGMAKLQQQLGKRDERLRRMKDKFNAMDQHQRRNSFRIFVSQSDEEKTPILILGSRKVLIAK